MTTRRRFLMLMGSAGVLAAGAATGLNIIVNDEKALAAEPTISFGEERCAGCGMIIDDRRFAAGWIEPNGRQVHFDDVGCLVDHRRNHEPAEGTRFFAHDYTGERWLAAESATFALSSDFRSPMAYGVAASADGHQATGTAAEATVYSWDELPHHLESRGHH